METLRRANQINDSINEDLSVSDQSMAEHLITEGNYPISDEGETILKDRSRLCFVCDESKIDIFFICGNGLCSDCVLEHIKAQLDKYKIKVLSEKITFVCAGSCKCHVERELMENFMDTTTKEKYDEVLLKMYLSKSKDIISCPRSDCKGCGFIKNSDCEFSYSNFLNFKIFSNSVDTCYECPVCYHKWSNPEEKVTDLIDPRKFFKKFSYSNIKSQIKKYVTTKYCNKCNAPIEKAEGCKHIECNRCEYSFCWKCTEDWTTHLEKSCMGQFSNDFDDTIRPNFTVDLFLILSILFVFKFIFTFTIIFRIIWLILKISLFFLFLAVDAFILHGALLFLYKLHNRKKFFFTIAAGIIFEIILYYFNLHPYSENVYFIAEVIVLPMYACYMPVTKKFN